MITMDASLMELYAKKRITKDTVLNACHNYEFVKKRLGA